MDPNQASCGDGKHVWLCQLAKCFTNQLMRQCSLDSEKYGDLQINVVTYTVNGNKINVAGQIKGGDGSKVDAFCPYGPNQKILSTCPDQFCTFVS
ncbi:hypothetical protein PSTG_08300 [Puccinia striiformis f. sp. tritici PST-78]|nr:hypothetical protein PSTG_08300 [Puccinia striiformis f. sp. tritici PST-78]